MTNQEIFDKVAKHLLTQKKQCVDGNGVCKYRNSVDGTKCAAGCLIPDKLYNPLIEGCLWSPDLANDNYNILLQGGELLSKWYNSFSVENHTLIKKLQTIHDKNMPEFWKNELLTVTEIFELDSSILETLN